MPGFVLGVIGSGFSPWLLPPPAIFTVIALLWLVRILTCVPGRFLLGLAVGLALACTYGNAMMQARLPPNCTGQPLVVSGSVATLPRVTQFAERPPRQQFELIIESLYPHECAGPRRVQLNYYGPAKIDPGDRWRFAVKLRQPHGRANPGSSNRQAYYVQAGIDAVGSVRSAAVDTRLTSATSLLPLVNTWRARLVEAINVLEARPHTIAVLRALVAGDKSAIEFRLWRAFRDLGVTHLLVVSGLHIGLVGGFGFLLGVALTRLMRPGRVLQHALPALCGAVPALAYAGLAGLGLPVQRALVMLLVFLLADIFEHNSSSVRRLLISCVAVLTINPLAAVGSGFWLSFGAVAALLWLTAWRRPSRKRWVAIPAMHLYMCIAMIPLGGLFFGGVSAASALANLLMVPLIGSVVVPLALLAGCMELVGLSWASHAWSLVVVILEWGLNPLVDGVWLSSIQRHLFVEVASSHTGILLAIAGVAAFALPSSGLGRSIAVLCIAASLLPTRALPVGDTRKSTLTVLDVGQGTAIVVRSADKVLVYDTGGGDPEGYNSADGVLLPYLNYLGVNRLDSLVISHADLDHSAGAVRIVESMRPHRVRSGTPVTVPGDVLPCMAGESWRWSDDVSFQFLSPAGGGYAARNDASCVLAIQFGDYRVILAGDIEREQENTLVSYWRDALQADLLLIPHHGSATSSYHVFLKTVAPDIGVVSAGFANPFGHPHEDVMARLAEHEVKVYQTSASGALTFAIEPAGLQGVYQERSRWAPYWQ